MRNFSPTTPPQLLATESPNRLPVTSLFTPFLLLPEETAPFTVLTPPNQDTVILFQNAL